MKNEHQLRDFFHRVQYEIKQRFWSVTPSTVAGMGAVPGENGTTFRVWAPHADKLFVVGTFNDWSPWRSPLAREADGLWSTNIPQANVSDEYKFLIHHKSQRVARTDPYAIEVTVPFNNGRIHPPPAITDDTSFPVPALPELIIYELHIGTFVANGSVGTFTSAIEKLPYLQTLGINAIELMPVKQFPGDYSWGYNPSHPFAIAPSYGGRTALKELIQAAHAHGIAVIVDVVYNHFGPQELSLWQFDGWHQDNQGGIYFYNDWRSQTPWAHTRPDYGRSQVRQYISDNVRMWLDEFQVDGLRWDATSYIRTVHGHDGDPNANLPEGWQLMQAINAEMLSRYPHKISIAEDLQDNEWITKTTSDGGAGFKAQWDSRFVHPIRQAIITTRDEDRDMPAVGQAINFRYNDDPFQRVIYTESHDEVANGKARVPEEIAPGNAADYFARKRAVLGAAITFTTPGIPMIFQGQEFLESGWFDDHVPLDWNKADTNSGLWHLYRHLIDLRRNRAGSTAGLMGSHVNVFHVDNTAKLIAYHRWQEGGAGDDVIIIANFANRLHQGYSLGFPHEGLWHVRLNSDAQQYDELFSNHPCPDVIAARFENNRNPIDGMPCWGNVTIAPYSFLILSQG